MNRRVVAIAQHAGRLGHRKTAAVHNVTVEACPWMTGITRNAEEEGAFDLVTNRGLVKNPQQLG